MAPQTKASFAHEFQAAVAQLRADDQARVREVCGSVWTEIETALPSSWLTESTTNAMNEAVRAELGDEAVVSLYRHVGRRLVKSSFFQKTVEALIRVMGVHPHTTLKLMPRARTSMVKDSGTMTYEKVSPDVARLVVAGFPASTWRLGTTALMLQGVIEGIVAMMGAEPTVEIQDFSLTGGGCTYRVTWTY